MKLVVTDEGLVPEARGKGRPPLVSDEDVEASYEAIEDGPAKTGAWVYDVNVRLGPDGTLLPVRAERFVLGLADGFSEIEAWKMAEGKSVGYRTRCMGHPAFKARLEALVEEKTKLEAEGLGGEMMWAVKQNLRVARLGGDPAQIHRATTLLVDTAAKVGGFGAANEGSDAPTAGADAPRGPGRPPNSPKQLKGVEVEAMRSKLMNLGKKPVAVPE